MCAAGAATDPATVCLERACAFLRALSRHAGGGGGSRKASTPGMQRALCSYVAQGDKRLDLEWRLSTLSNPESREHATLNLGRCNCRPAACSCGDRGLFIPRPTSGGGSGGGGDGLELCRDDFLRLTQWHLFRSSSSRKHIIELARSLQEGLPLFWQRLHPVPTAAELLRSRDLGANEQLAEALRSRTELTKEEWLAETMQGGSVSAPSRPDLISHHLRIRPRGSSDAGDIFRPMPRFEPDSRYSKLLRELRDVEVDAGRRREHRKTERRVCRELVEQLLKDATASRPNRLVSLPGLLPSGGECPPSRLVELQLQNNALKSVPDLRHLTSLVSLNLGGNELHCMKEHEWARHSPTQCLQIPVHPVHH